MISQSPAIGTLFSWTRLMTLHVYLMLLHWNQGGSCKPLCVVRNASWRYTAKIETQTSLDPWDWFLYQHEDAFLVRCGQEEDSAQVLWMWSLRCSWWVSCVLNSEMLVILFIQYTTKISITHWLWLLHWPKLSNNFVWSCISLHME